MASLDREQQGNLAYGKHASPYARYLMMEVILEELKTENLDDVRVRDAMKDTIGMPIEDAWTKLTTALSITNADELLDICRQIWKPAKRSLVDRLIATYGKTKMLSNVDDWFDNGRVGCMCESMNMVTWDEYDAERSYAVQRKPLPINVSASTSFDASRVVTYLVGALRRFIVENDFYPKRDLMITNPTDSHMGDLEVCDKCYQIYPFYSNGCHGCDFSSYAGLALSVRELAAFNRRYPSAIVGMVLNRATYASGNGTHWISMCFKGSTAYMVDSVGYEHFDDDGVLRNEMTAHGYSFLFNPVCFQANHFSCGMFATLSTYIMLCNDCNIDQTVTTIGTNGEDIYQGKDVIDFTRILAFAKKE